MLTQLKEHSTTVFYINERAVIKIYYHEQLNINIIQDLTRSFETQEAIFFT